LRCIVSIEWVGYRRFFDFTPQATTTKSLPAASVVQFRWTQAIVRKIFTATELHASATAFVVSAEQIVAVGAVFFALLGRILPNHVG
jgi:hypothetical protein